MTTKSQQEITAPPLVCRPRRRRGWRVALSVVLAVVIAAQSAALWAMNRMLNRVSLMGKVEASSGLVHAQDRLEPWAKSILTHQMAHALRGVSVLDAGRAALDRSDVRTIASFSDLKVLNASDVSDEDLNLWRRLQKLGGLHVSGRSITDAGVEHLLALPALKYLTLSATSITDAGLARLAQHPNLHVVRIGSTSTVTDAGVAHLAELPQILEIAIVNCPVTDASVAPLVKAPRLMSLTIEYAPITDAVLPELAKAEGLVYLNLRGTRITDAAIETLAAMKNLQTIGLDETRMSEAGLRELAQIRGFSETELIHTPLTLEEFLRSGIQKAGPDTSDPPRRLD